MRAVAEDALGAALGVAATAPSPLGEQLASVAKAAFVVGLHAGLVAAAGAALVGAVGAFVLLPAFARHEDVEEQVGEFVVEHATDIGFAPSAAPERADG
ncbi:MAG: hypothetical protein FJW88_01405 [Actinobacteria bacterium]|nr:hypothetical protein [Actinomycetota bacterium]